MLSLSTHAHTHTCRRDGARSDEHQLQRTRSKQSPTRETRPRMHMSNARPRMHMSNASPRMHMSNAGLRMHMSNAGPRMHMSNADEQCRPTHAHEQCKPTHAHEHMRTPRPARLLTPTHPPTHPPTQPPNHAPLKAHTQDIWSSTAHPTCQEHELGRLCTITR